MTTTPKPITAEAPATATQKTPKGDFLGFAPPTSNTTYTPNQFFDVCLPHYSRGVVRLVAYMIRKTLGWCDANGNPQEDTILVSYQDLVNRAGISRDMIREAIDEAIAANFIRCVRKGRPKSANKPAITALYELCWHDTDEYIRDPELFQGFYEGEGNRTDIPNQFFDYVIPNEPLSLIKVVGSVIRFSIGFQARRGRRRQQVQLSYSDIQRYANIRNRTILSSAISDALDKNYLVRIKEGLFTPTTEEQTSTTYAVKWLDVPFYLPIGQKNVPEAEEGIGQKNVPGERSEKRTRNGQKNVPEDRSEKRTSIEIKHINETKKQQQQAENGLLVAVAQLDIFNILKNEGFSTRDAEALANAHPEEQIRNQINWLRKRNPNRNRLGMLRRAIEENWPEPLGSSDQERTKGPCDARTFAMYFYAGFSGNRDVPTAEPSGADTEAAERFVSHLLKVWPDQNRISQWGYEFGQMVSEKTQGHRNTIVSCVIGLRSYGDEFYKQVKRTRQEVIQEAVKKARIEHKREFLSEYIQHLLAEEERIKTESPEAYAAFEEERVKERGFIEKNRFYSDEQRAEQLRLFEEERHRLNHFVQFFKQVPGFWQWDAVRNPHAFDKSRVAV